MPPTSSARAIPRPPLLPEQARRREQNRVRARQRAVQYPTDPETGRRIPRDSPRALFPTVPGTTSARVALEHLSKPNEFLYLLQYTDAPVSTYAFHTPDGSRWRQPFPSIFQACVSAAQAGYLDASW